MLHPRQWREQLIHHPARASVQLLCMARMREALDADRLYILNYGVLFQTGVGPNSVLVVANSAQLCLNSV